MRLSPELLKELELSAIAADLAELNFQTLTPDDCWEYLLYGLPDSDRRNDGRLRDGILKTYAHLNEGGWWCNGIDITTGQESLWGCLKPVTPRKDPKGKLIKYEHPPKVATEAFFLKVPDRIARKIATKAGLEVSYLDAKSQGLTFWEWVIATPALRIIITEGSKKAASLLSAGYCAVALSGIYGGYRIPKDENGKKIGLPYLVPQMEAIAQKGREIVWAFDNDRNPKTIINVRIATAQTAKLFDLKGCKTSIMTWEKEHPEIKGIDDVHHAKGEECLDLLFTARLSLDRWKDLQTLDISPYASLTVTERYLQNHNPDLSAVIMAIKSAKGSGKTKWLVERVAKNIHNGIKTLVITHRIQLGRALAKVFGLPYLDEIRDEVTGDLFGFVLCADSLHAKSAANFNPDDWHGADVIIDEAEQVFWHILTADTDIAKHRVNVINNLQLTLQNAVRGGGKIYLSDADLSPIAIEYVRGLLGYDAPVWCLVNDWKPKGKRLHVYEGMNPRNLIAALKKAIAKGEKVLIHVSGQKAKSAWGTQALEAYFIKMAESLEKQFPDKSVLRIDGETVADPDHPAFGIMDKLDETLKTYDIVIASPTIETGVSIDLKGHFDSVWGIFQGIQTVDSVAQTLERLREPVPRHVWFNNCGLFRVGKGETTVKSLLKCTHDRTAKHRDILTQADISVDGIDYENGITMKSLLCWAKRGAIVNRTIKTYSDVCLEKLLSEGYETTEAPVIDDEGAKVIEKEIKLCRDEIYDQEKQGTCDAEIIDEARREALQRKRSLTKTERYQLRKANLKLSYGITPIPELVEFDDDGGYRKIQTLYYLTTGAEYAARRFGKSLENLRDDGHGVIFKPDQDKRLSLLTILKVCTILDIPRYFDLNEEWTSAKLADFHEKAKSCRQDIKKYLGFNVAPNAIACLQQFLDLAGRELEKTGKSTRQFHPEKKAELIYRIVPPPAFYSEVLVFFRQKDDPSFSPSTVETVVANPIINICNRFDATENIVEETPSPAPMATAIAPISEPVATMATPTIESPALMPLETYKAGDRVWFKGFYTGYQWVMGTVDKFISDAQGTALRVFGTGNHWGMIEDPENVAIA